MLSAFTSSRFVAARLVQTLYISLTELQCEAVPVLTMGATELKA